MTPMIEVKERDREGRGRDGALLRFISSLHTSSSLSISTMIAILHSVLSSLFTVYHPAPFSLLSMLLILPPPPLFLSLLSVHCHSFHSSFLLSAVENIFSFLTLSSLLSRIILLLLFLSLHLSLPFSFLSSFLFSSLVCILLLLSPLLFIFSFCTPRHLFSLHSSSSLLSSLFITYHIPLFLFRIMILFTNRNCSVYCQLQRKTLGNRKS
jgi:hypothetical protein